MRKKYIFHLLGSFLNSQGWAKERQEPEMAMASHTGGRNRGTWALICCLPGTLEGSCIWSKGEIVSRHSNMGCGVSSSSTITILEEIRFFTKINFIPFILFFYKLFLHTSVPAYYNE